MNRTGCVLALLLLAGCDTLASRGGAFRARPDQDVTELFDHEWGWTGADAAYSVAIPSSGTLWLFGDTILDRWSPRPKMVRNSIGVQSGKDMDFFWGEGNKDFFPPRSEGTWLWPGDGFVKSGKLNVFLHEFAKHGEGAFGFQRTGTWLATIENPGDAPGAWRISYEKAPFPGEHTYFGIACLEERDQVYVYGALEEREARHLILARILADGTWEFLNESGWEKAPGKLRRLGDGIGAELTVTHHRDRYYLVTTENGLSSRIVLDVADTPEGPFDRSFVLYECREPSWDPSYFCYAAKAHPELEATGPGGRELVVTYCCNSTEFKKLFEDRRIYRPRAVTVFR